MITKVVLQCAAHPLHSDVLIPAISPNVGNPTAEFVVVGDCVCAFP